MNETGLLPGPANLSNLIVLISILESVVIIPEYFCTGHINIVVALLRSVSINKILINANHDVCRPAISHAFRVRLQQLPSLMCDSRLGLLPYFQNIFALTAAILYMLSLSKISLI